MSPTPSAPERLLLISPAFHGYWRSIGDALARRGYEGTRVSDIAGEAGLSNSALYAYFTSKAELLLGALRTHGRPLARCRSSEDASNCTETHTSGMPLLLRLLSAKSMSW